MADLQSPESLRLIPEPQQVFHQPEFHAQHFLPLFSFELSEVFDDLSGILHFVDPVEPYDGCIGSYTEAFHSYYCRENWISFKIKDGLYEFEGPENFFSYNYWKSHQVPDTIAESVRDGWVDAETKHREKRQQKYNDWKLKHAKLPLEDAKLDIHLGGKPHDANWVHTVDFPMSTDEVAVPDQSYPDTFHYPLTEDGRRFCYIGYCETFDWRCELHLFYDPAEQRVLQTFDWT